MKMPEGGADGCLRLPKRGSGFDKAGANGVTHHAGGLVNAELFEDAAAMRIRGLVADTELGGGFLGGFAGGDQDQDLAFALRKCEDEADGRFIRREHAAAAIADIDGGTDETGEHPIFSAWESGIFDPGEFAVGAAHAVLHAEGLTGGKGLEVGFQTEIAVVGVNSFGPSVAAFLFKGAAAEFQPRLIKEGAHGVGTRHPCHEGAAFRRSRKRC